MRASATLHLSGTVAKSLANVTGQLCCELVIDSWVSNWPSKMVPFQDYTSTSGHTTSLRYKPQYLSKSRKVNFQQQCLLYSQTTEQPQISDENNTLHLYACAEGFCKSGHKCVQHCKVETLLHLCRGITNYVYKQRVMRLKCLLLTIYAKVICTDGSQMMLIVVYAIETTVALYATSL